MSHASSDPAAERADLAARSRDVTSETLEVLGDGLQRARAQLSRVATGVAADPDAAAKELSLRRGSARAAESKVGAAPFRRSSGSRLALVDDEPQAHIVGVKLAKV